jgi:hypothetical protein
MFSFTFLTVVLKGNLLLVVVPEALSVLAFGLGLVGATAGLRWVLRRRDEKFDEKE